MSEMSLYLESSVWLRLVLSIVLSGIIGWERELHGRPAGIRTHIMVCLGSTMLILSSEYFHIHSSGGQFDSDRMASGIITGIGFLGAGAIMREGNLVRGLTTAGCLWFVAGLGIVVGEKYYALAVWITLSALVMLVALRYVESRLSVLHFQDMVVRVLIQDYDNLKAKCLDLFIRNGVKIEARKFLVDNIKNEVEVRFTMRLQRGKLLEEIIFDVSRLPGVKEVRF